MDAAEFKQGLITLWGDPTWRTKAPEAFDTTVSTLDRYANGHTKIHPCAARLLEHLLKEKRRRARARDYERAARARRRGA